MRVITSQLAGGDNNADRVLVTENAVLVLDGATAFEPVPVDPGDYAEMLGHEVTRHLTLDPARPLSEAVAEGISAVVKAFNLEPGRSPSSTISILRTRGNSVDLFALGDSPIYYGTSTTTQMLLDNRLAELGSDHLAPLYDAIRAAAGYTDEHREALAVLQRAQRHLRNTPEGYWIAETYPLAAYRAITTTVEDSAIDWAVLGTDGAADLIEFMAPDDWSNIARYDQQRLDELLASIHRWESETDPNGQKLPRAKRHDDKTLAAISNLRS